MSKKALGILLYASVPFVPGISRPRMSRKRSAAETAPPPVQRHCPTSREIRFFEEISDNLVPLLQMFERLEKDGVPFKIALALSPLFCFALENKTLIEKYLAHLDRQIAFGNEEAARNANCPPLARLSRFYTEHYRNIRRFLKKHDNDVLKIVHHFNLRGNLEILAGAATDAYLPFYTSYPAALNAQIGAGLESAKLFFCEEPAGFFLPSMAYHPELDDYILDRHFTWTVVDTHSLLLASPPPLYGSFYPARTKKGLTVFARDFELKRELEKAASGHFRDNARDAGYELEHCAVEGFGGKDGERYPTGYKYWFRDTAGGACKTAAGCYDAKEAWEEAANAAKRFAGFCGGRLEKAASLMEGKTPYALIAADMDSFGRNWAEGSVFLEALFREVHASSLFNIMTPYEFLVKENARNLERLALQYSSGGSGGYHEAALSSANDWIYRHIFHAIERMSELAAHFDDRSLRERCLNQAARELMLAQDSSLAAGLADERTADYARALFESHIKSFTAIYESLGYNFISARHLTMLEERGYILPSINYRVFSGEGNKRPPP